MSEQFVKLANGTNVSIESWADCDELVLNTSGQPVIVRKQYGPLDLPDVRVHRDGEQWVIEILVEHGFEAVPDGALISDYAHDVRDCRVCAGEVWREIYRGGGPTVADEPVPFAKAVTAEGRTDGGTVDV